MSFTQVQVGQDLQRDFLGLEETAVERDSPSNLPHTESTLYPFHSQTGLPTGLVWESQLPAFSSRPLDKVQASCLDDNPAFYIFSQVPL